MPGALVLVVVLVLAGRARSSKLVLAESGALHCTALPTSKSNVNPPSRTVQAAVPVDAIWRHQSATSWRSLCLVTTSVNATRAQHHPNHLAFCHCTCRRSRAGFQWPLADIEQHQKLAINLFLLCLDLIESPTCPYPSTVVADMYISSS